MSNKIAEKLKKFGGFLLKLIATFAVLALIYSGVDFVFKNLLSSTSRAVLSNFLLFALIIGLVMKNVVHPKAMLEQEQAVIEAEIKDSENAKVESEERLSTIEESILHIEEEVNAIIKKSEENAQLVGEKIIQDAEKTALVVRDNANKVIENNQNLLRNDLIRRASLASIEVAKNHIINELNNNTELHDKLINESIEAIVLNTEEVEEV